MRENSSHTPHELPPILQVGDVLIASDIITECFCCDYETCKGACCVEGDAGAPVTLEEIGEIEDVLDDVWKDLSASAQAVIDKQGVAYSDRDGDLVTSIVAGKDCVFTCYDNGNCLCALEKIAREKGNHNYQLSILNYQFIKPISCALYPIREKTFSNGLVGLNYHRWDICKCGREKGKALNLPLYKFLREPLIRRFGKEWYDELDTLASTLNEER